MLSNYENLPLDRLVKFIRSPIDRNANDDVDPDRVIEVVEINVKDPHNRKSAQKVKLSEI